ncbi:hypothetical protein C474_01052 [Halogeometricum pallidum JCM 14848]|uniref:Uncharacterized protein n=1 Tax=Halogeometricum pallidum JCM 14848 TaxID=1227487 RepID=M0DHG4_HALPD|nr:hypothetical protein [Halogeometricum pallidum]ELZ34905.1 hypothetical protein C474_01052 [Halogeometricum pallidum JCM 14848]
MVGPSMSDEERAAASTHLKVGFVLLVAVSGALVAFQSGGTPTLVGGAFLVGLFVGLLLIFFLVRWWADFVATTNRGRSR